MKQTYCKRGHPLQGENLYVRPGNGNRMCRACGRIRERSKTATPQALAYYRQYWRDYRAAHLQRHRDYNRVYMADMRRMRRLLEVIAYQVVPVEPVGLMG